MHRLSFHLLAPLLVLGLAAAPASAAGQKKVIYFSTWSADMDDAARAVVDEAASFAKQQKKALVGVSGFASTTGSRRANQMLSDLRAQVVVDRLVEQGVNAARIRQSSRGASHFVSTPLESRRVEVTVGGR